MDQIPGLKSGAVLGERRSESASEVLISGMRNHRGTSAQRERNESAITRNGRILAPLQRRPAL